MKHAVFSPEIRFREKIFSTIPFLRSLPFIFLSSFFFILWMTGIFDFKVSEKSVSILNEMAPDYLLYLALPILILSTCLFYINHKRVEQKTFSVHHLQKCTDAKKQETMKMLRMARARQLIVFEIKRAAIKTFVLLVPAALITVFLVLMLNKNIRGTHTITIMYSFFAVMGLGILAYIRLNNKLEKGSDWGTMSETFLQSLLKQDYINHGMSRGNESFLQWLDYYWAEPVEIDYAKKGVGFSFEKGGIQLFLFADSASSSILYIFAAVILPESKEDKNKKSKDNIENLELHEIIDNLKDWHYDLNIYPGGVLLKAEQWAVESIMKDYREYDGTELPDIITRMLKAVSILDAKPGASYSLFSE